MAAWRVSNATLACIEEVLPCGPSAHALEYGAANLRLARFNAEPCGFPKPRVSLLPVKPELQVSGFANVFKRQSATQFRHFTRGRYALEEAYRLSGVGPTGALLAPAYHCVTMLDPALALGADVQLYPLHPDLSPDLNKLDEILAAYGGPVRALLGTHFFGFARNFSGLKSWCEKHRIVLIEDCSHVLFTENFQATGTGLYGRFVVSSPYKFFACEDGGLLYSPEASLPDSVKTRSASLVQEVRGIKRVLDRWRSACTLPSETGLIDDRFAALRMKPVITAEEQIAPYSQPSSLYTVTESRTAALRSSRFIVSHSSIAENIRQRQDNYRRWVEAAAALPNCRALFPDLPENCAPYMFPLHIDYPAPHFYWLKHLGVPIWRWDEMAISNCPVAQDYRLHLLHLPCHQTLSEAGMDWLTATVQKILRQPAQGVQ
jgi:dTDP-4-amino-4,6-dideoxygalactose transaminase